MFEYCLRSVLQSGMCHLCTWQIQLIIFSLFHVYLFWLLKWFPNLWVSQSCLISLPCHLCWYFNDAWVATSLLMIILSQRWRQYSILSTFLVDILWIPILLCVVSDQFWMSPYLVVRSTHCIFIAFVTMFVVKIETITGHLQKPALAHDVWITLCYVRRWHSENWFHEYSVFSIKELWWLRVLTTCKLQTWHTSIQRRCSNMHNITYQPLSVDLRMSLRMVSLSAQQCNLVIWIRSLCSLFHCLS